jgi:hypothetical protein
MSSAALFDRPFPRDGEVDRIIHNAHRIELRQMPDAVMSGMWTGARGCSQSGRGVFHKNSGKIVQMARGNPNPVTKFKKGHKKVDGSGRQPGQPNYLTADVRKLIRQAAEETGFITTVPVLDAEGKPTGQFEEKMIEEGERGTSAFLSTTGS